MTIYILVLVYQSFVTHGIAMTTVSHFDTKEQCLAAAANLNGYDKKDCVMVSK